MDQVDITKISAKQFLGIKSIVWKNFFGGMAWGVGSVIGATIVVAILVLLLKTVRFAPVVGDFVSSVIQVVQENQVKSLDSGQSNN